MIKTLQEVGATSIAEVERRPPVQVSRETAVGAVIDELRERGRGSVMVMEGSKLVGIFTERDVMKRIDMSAPRWDQTPVGELMTPEPRTIRTDQTVEDALNLMVAGGHRHLPTVEPDGTLVGLISIRDLLIHVVGFFPDDFVNLPTDPGLEPHEPWGG